MINTREKILSMPPVKEMMKSNGVFTKKSLGQNFLFDLNLTDKIARKAAPLEGRTIIEIGPGPGGLTRMILANGAEKLIVIEHDSTCIPILNDLKDLSGNHLEIIEQDALKINERTLLQEHNITNPVKIVANLPYNIATELLFKWLDNIELFESLTLMFQKEVAARIAAKPNSKTYGILSVISQWLCEVNIDFDVNPSAFYPPPKVTSSVITLIPRAQPLAPANMISLKKVVKAAFGQRRKTLRVSLRQISDDSNALLKRAGINPQLRAENLDVIQFCALARAFEEIA